MRRLGYTTAQIARDLGIKRTQSVYEYISRGRTPETMEHHRAVQRAGAIRRARSKGVSPRSSFWTLEREIEVALLWQQGLTFSEIGERLGVTRNAIAGKVGRLGLPWRKPPERTSKAA